MRLNLLLNWLTIVETNTFIKESKKLLDEDDLNSLKSYLATIPESGDIIPGLKGIRKLRWQANQKGKRGGARVIYFFYNNRIPLFLLDIYPKSKKEDISSADKKLLNDLVNHLIDQYGEQHDKKNY